MVGRIHRDRMLVEVLGAVDGEAGSGDGHASAGPYLGDTVLCSPCLRPKRGDERCRPEDAGGEEEERGLEDVAAPSVQARHGVGALAHGREPAGTDIRSRSAWRASPTRYTEPEITTTPPWVASVA